MTLLSQRILRHCCNLNELNSYDEISWRLKIEDSGSVYSRVKCSMGNFSGNARGWWTVVIQGNEEKEVSKDLGKVWTCLWPGTQELKSLESTGNAHEWGERIQIIIVLSPQSLRVLIRKKTHWPEKTSCSQRYQKEMCRRSLKKQVLWEASKQES